MPSVRGAGGQRAGGRDQTRRCEAEIVKVKDIREIAARGVMVTPALVIDGQVKSSGKLLSPEEIEAMLS